jgi:hypothetical protein
MPSERFERGQSSAPNHEQQSRALAVAVGLEKPQPLGNHPYKIAISPEELEIAVHHRALTGEPLQTFVRRLIRQSPEAQALGNLIIYGAER